MNPLQRIKELIDAIAIKMEVLFLAIPKKTSDITNDGETGGGQRYVQETELKTVAFTGNFNDLTNVPSGVGTPTLQEVIDESDGDSPTLQGGSGVDGDIIGRDASGKLIWTVAGSELTADELAGIQGATDLKGSNPVATLNDIPPPTPSGVQSVTGDGVGGTPEDVVMTFPTADEIDGFDDKVTNNPAVVALGETSTTAYRGDRGKIAYDHSQLPHAPSDAQKNVNSDWLAADGDAEILNKPTRVNFNIYNQTKNNAVTISNTVKTVINPITTGSGLLPTTAKDSAYIGRIFGKFTSGGSSKNITLEFKIANTTREVVISNSDSSSVVFYVDYTINYLDIRTPTISGVVTVGDQSFLIDLDFGITSSAAYEISAILTGGTLVINSSYLHRNHN